MGGGTPSILGSSLIARPRPPTPALPRKGGGRREIGAPDATGTYRIINGIGSKVPDDNIQGAREAVCGARGSQPRSARLCVGGAHHGDHDSPGSGERRDPSGIGSPKAPRPTCLSSEMPMSRDGLPRECHRAGTPKMSSDSRREADGPHHDRAHPWPSVMPTSPSRPDPPTSARCGRAWQGLAS